MGHSTAVKKRTSLPTMDWMRLLLPMEGQAYKHYDMPRLLSYLYMRLAFDSNM